MKKKVVEHLAGQVQHAILQIENNAAEMVQNNRNILCTSPTEGIGLDMACLRESVEEAKKLIWLLT